MNSHTLLACSLLTLCLGSTAAAQLPRVQTPPGNPTTNDKINLGKTLFWDEQLSSSRTVACGTCHMPDAGGADPRSAFALNPGFDGIFGTADDVHGAVGLPLSLADGTYIKSTHFGFDVQVTGRTAPSAINAAYNAEQFWDGREGGVFEDPLNPGVVILNRFASLENQAKNPPTGDAEMAHQGRNWQDVADQIAVSKPLALSPNAAVSSHPLPSTQTLDQWIGSQSYPDLFNLVFGDPAVTPARIIMAIAAYERILISDQTPFDQSQMTARQQQGQVIFEGKGRCNLCHEGALFRDLKYHNIGLRPSDEDLGRFNVTSDPLEKGAFKTPGMRNVGLKTALMHNGMHLSLSETIELYDRGGDFFDNIDPLMQPLGLTSVEKVALLDFIENGLTDPRVKLRMPPFDPPELYFTSSRVPVNYGVGAPGTDGIAPRLLGIEPAMLGNPNFTLTLADGLGGQMAAIAFDMMQGTGSPLAGVPVHVAGTGAMVVIPIGTLQGAATGGEGWWSGSLPIPSNAALSGAQIFAQGFASDPGAAFGVTGTPGLDFTLFAPR